MKKRKIIIITEEQTKKLINQIINKSKINYLLKVKEKK